MTDPNFATMSGQQNGSPSDQELDDTFEQDLRDMLRDGPSLSDTASNIQGGNVTESPFAAPPPQMGQAKSSPNTGNYAGTGGGFAGPGDNGDSTSALAKAKFDSFKTWSISTYKCTRQMLSEKLGKGSRTVDLQLEAQIEVLRDTQRKYANILKLSRALTHHFYQVVQTQRSLGDAFGELGQKSPELQEEFNYNCETQRSLCSNGETLLGALNFFTSNVNTLCNKTMEDTLMTVKLYESARIEYDAYRVDLESLQIAPKDSTTQSKINEARTKYDKQKIKFDKLRQDVSVKLKFLEENKVKVMHKQLLLFHNAISAYFSGNQQALEATLKQFSIKLRPPSEVQPSFLEQ
ncbi:arfaptin-2-like isoform X2 [Antedon mediterranea]|uniref:arfaptin-2-like isoform X2 n=1 Tax=Antedon mediterranea TaxID=105859 RepID=UPI003AF6EA02